MTNFIAHGILAISKFRSDVFLFFGQIGTGNTSVKVRYVQFLLPMNDPFIQPKILTSEEVW